jgi:hypothetical protein
MSRILFTLTMIVLLPVIACRSNERQPLGFPFEVIAEGKEDLGDHALKYVDLLISRQDYSEANIDQLFRFYSEKISEERAMAIRVYTDRQRYEECERRKSQPQVFICINDPGSEGLYDALFHRVNDKEWYFYSLDLEQPLIYHLNLSDGSGAKQVVLKGEL